MAPYEPYATAQTNWQPDQYHMPTVVNIIGGIPRYGYTRDIYEMLSGGFKKDEYVQG
jgi:hypothetical protein